MAKPNKQPRRPRKNSYRAGFMLLAMVTLIIGFLGFQFSTLAITKQKDGQSLAKNAQKQYETANIVQAKRGTIFDAVGNPLAENTTLYTVAIVVSRTAVSRAKPAEYGEIATKLASVLGGDTSYFEKYLNAANGTTYQVEFGTRGADVKASDYKKLKALKIPGLTASGQVARLYPNGVFASNLIGLASNEEAKDGLTEIVGKMGLEAAYNKQLTGKNGKLVESEDNQSETPTKESVTAKNGYDVYTTLNSTLQSTLENELGNLATAMEPRATIAILMDTQTGDIVAEAQRPSYNATTGDGLGDFWTNELVEDPYEPGSVMKGVTLAAAIDTGNWNGNATFKSGTLEIGDSKVTDWNNGQGWGTMTYSDGLSYSSNVAMALTEQKMGATTWGEYIKKFRFLKKTSVGLLGEQKGEYQFKYPIEQANTAFGQGISVTPIQMLQAYTAIAGNGQEIRPNLIKKIVDPNTNKVVYESKRKVVASPISEETAKATREQLKTVVYGPSGTGEVYAIPNVETTGKTGTAQISTANGYGELGDASKEVHSWIGMAPADNPRYMMYIVVKEPKNPDGVTTKMATVFKNVMTQALTMTESNNQVVESNAQEVAVPTVVNESAEQAIKDVQNAKLTPLQMGDGQTVVSQSPVGGQKTLVGARVFLNTGSGIAVPDMRGWSRSDVLAWAKLADVSIVIKGNGFAATQSVAVGTKIDTGIHEITVEFKKPA
jgi:penicillin-binding protein 2B